MILTQNMFNNAFCLCTKTEKCFILYAASVRVCGMVLSAQFIDCWLPEWRRTEQKRKRKRRGDPT